MADYSLGTGEYQRRPRAELQSACTHIRLCQRIQSIVTALNPVKSEASRHFTALDHVLGAIDDGLRLLSGLTPPPARTNPAAALPEPELSPAERAHVAGLMRINHAGEICAQALYAGQAATARAPAVRQAMSRAADEEIDHLAWCAERLAELDSRPSLLDPFWYSGAFALGALAGTAGDRWSLGFLRETERQVEAHLQDHLDRLPEQDARSAAILAQMQMDEAEHARMAEAAGAVALPQPVQLVMRFMAGVMKQVAYRL